MSPDLGSPTTLSDQEHVLFRWYAGYPAYGSGPTIDPFNRTFAEFPELEFRLNNLTSAEIAWVRLRLPELQSAEAALGGMSTSLDTDKAAVWTRNRTELADRRAHYYELRKNLALFLQISPGPGLRESSRSVSLIV